MITDGQPSLLPRPSICRHCGTLGCRMAKLMVAERGLAERWPKGDKLQSANQLIPVLQATLAVMHLPPHARENFLLS